jgi:hypothetical protein
MEAPRLSEGQARLRIGADDVIQLMQAVRYVILFSSTSSLLLLLDVLSLFAHENGLVADQKE